jgi:hypothetical protein
LLDLPLPGRCCDPGGDRLPSRLRHRHRCKLASATARVYSRSISYGLYIRYFFSTGFGLVVKCSSISAGWGSALWLIANLTAQIGAVLDGYIVKYQLD